MGWSTRHRALTGALAASFFVAAFALPSAQSRNASAKGDPPPAVAQAARLAVLLPAPKRFEKRPASPYVLGRAATIMARMGAVDIP